MNVEGVNVKDLIDNLGHLLQRILGEDIVLQIPSNKETLAIKADAGMIEQVLLNLVVNARDAMPKGGQLIIGTSLVTIDQAFINEHPQAQAGEFVCVSVTDFGCGRNATTVS